MRITERRLRQIIRSVIKESNKQELEHYDSMNDGYLPNIEAIGSAYFQHVHNGGMMEPQEWADANLNMNSYMSDSTRSRVMNKLEDAYNSPAHRMPSGR